MKEIITKEVMQGMIGREDSRYVMHVVGRALVALYNRQTNMEKGLNDTKEQNGIGFSGVDARSGSITAKYYIKNGMLEDWMVEKWIRVGKGRYGRIVKYHKQLNEVANEKLSSSNRLRDRRG